jgi:polysaccharide pyruvyl transferase WcaK-like protein
MAELDRIRNTDMNSGAEPRPGSGVSIGLLGTFGNGNLGDSAILEAILANLSARCPGARIFGFSVNPADTESRHGIRAFPIRRRYAAKSSPAPGPSPKPGVSPPSDRLKRVFGKAPPLLRASRKLREGWEWFASIPGETAFFYRSVAALKSIDVLMVAGGGQIFDYVYGPWGHPFTLFQWSLAARLARTRMIFVSVGADRLRHPLSRWFIRASLAWADYRSCRDGHSRNILQGLGLKADIPVFPDLAFSLTLPPRSAAIPARNLIGISPMAYMHPDLWPSAEPGVYGRYLDCLGKTVLGLLRRGFRISLFPSQLKMDTVCIEELLRFLARNGIASGDPRLLLPQVTDVAGLVRAIEECHVLIASRFHGILLSLLARTPALSISYQEKNDVLMRDVGMGEFLADIRHCDEAGLAGKLSALLADRENALARLEGRIAVYKQALATQYDLICGNFLAAPGKAHRDSTAPRARNPQALARQSGSA